MKIIDKFYSFIYKSMARHCKDCPDKNQEVIEKEQEEIVEEWTQPKPKVFFFPNEWVRIEADTYEEALKILSNNKE